MAKKPYIEEQTTEARQYKGSIKIESDLFKLLVEKTNKNMSFSEGSVELEAVEHIHFWRTYDSDGRKLKYSAPIAGHFHEIEYKEMPSGRVKIISCSGPLRMLTEKIKGKLVTHAVPLPDELEDKHTHDLKYLRSQTIAARETNSNAVNIMATEAQKTAPIAGIIG